LMTNFDTEPFSGQFSKHIKKFCQQLSDFLGLVYEPLLLGYAKHRCTPKIEIAYENHIYNVLPRDPFWKNFTPDSISSRLELPSSHSLSFKDEDKKLMECIIEYGTIKTISRDVTIDMGEDFSNKKEIIEISSYVIPRNTIRSRIPGIYQRNVIATGPKDTGSGTLRADRMSGFFFYRNGRCICFGDTGARSQFGWYGWKGSIPHKWVRVRFEVKFPESMDEYMKLSPTKDKVNPPNDFFKQIRQQVEQVIYEPLLRGSLGTKSLPFYDQNNEDKSVSGLDADSKYGNIEDCIHCGLFQCKIPGCPPDHCTYQCSLCPNIGHIERNCPTNCKYCEYPNGAGGHNGEPCPLLCDTCGIFNCDGPCNGCNNCICECLCPNCGKKGLPCDCRKTKLQGPVLSQHSMIIEVNKRYKNESILYIKQAMDFLGLQIEDLE
jgi:hypothetical protein